MEEGIEKGMERGMQRGMERGVERGRAEGILIVAKNLKQDNFPLDVISKSTGVSLEILKSL